MLTFAPSRPGGVASSEDLLDLAAIVAALVLLERALLERVPDVPLETVDARQATVRAHMLGLAAAIATDLGSPRLFEPSSPTISEALAESFSELARVLVAKAIESGRI